MNYEPITAGNQTNGDAGIETNVNAGQARQEKASDHEYILLPLMLSNSPLSSSSQSTDNKDADEVPGKGDDDLSERNGQEKEEGALNKENDQHVQDFRAELDNLLVQQKEGFDNVDDQERIDSSTQDVNTVRPSINTASENINTRSSNINTASPIPNDPSMQSCYIKKQRETKSQRLSKTAYLLVFSLTIQKPNGIQALTDPSWIEAIQEELLQFILQKLECESTFLYGTIEEEVYACQPPGFKDPQFPDKVYKEEGTIDKLCSSRRTEMMHKRFQMSSIGELTFFLGLQVQQKEDGIFISQDKDSPFDLEAFSNSDYAGASLDRKSTTGGYQFLGKRLISWQCKKQNYRNAKLYY
ncbi:putative ribonuclease H-like domain-containing protein [Tanacetum coccineum]|uniref:Ribonuclease H-like domain-containing protein n=1 Tax=Tanacetum coccineum TaxID=301880 RepID=A0ABQ5EPV2_9ASTR